MFSMGSRIIRRIIVRVLRLMTGRLCMLLRYFWLILTKLSGCLMKVYGQAIKAAADSAKETNFDLNMA